MKEKDFKAFLNALSQLEEEKGIEKEKMIETVEQALLAAYKKNYGEEKEATIRIDRKKGYVKVYAIKRVVDELPSNHDEISLKEARSYDKTVEIGDEIEIEEKCEAFKRNAIQNAKQIVIQKVREAERETLFSDFKEKEDSIITGTIRRIDERGNVFIEIGLNEILLPTIEQSIGDVYRVGERIKVYVAGVEKTTKHPKIIISRKRPELVKKLFEIEIPEIEDGVIEVKSIAREAGNRSKVAVYSEDINVDTVGACIGQNGMRIKEVVRELNGEKIDIVKWVEDKEEYVANALSPAKVKSVKIIAGEGARVIVTPDQLSLAIGKSGQNARLAAKLTGIRVDIKTEEKKEDIVKEDEE
ncbi:transcription termination factor NusA [Haliovirga abyssi]|uniref:Transcription termination/antitermination protein NusA n=1 Tax=Haliovirga abyssi TaxID=2996794 RepID=A0AAU9D8N8_9FUSO|nr:transcription termination factor NusA [Haliovirga abyssi]BDU49956.1 transcription termination/antitermination protein NusA [Haliovirga abyssi]